MRVIALGFFDGVHIGHGALLRRTRERATELGLRAAAMSFDSHPDTLVSGVPVPLINSMDDRAALMSVRVKSGDDFTEREVRLHDKVRALELLGKHLGMFTEKVELSGERVRIVDDVPEAARDG